LIFAEEVRAETVDFCRCRIEQIQEVVVLGLVEGNRGGVSVRLRSSCGGLSHDVVVKQLIPELVDEAHHWKVGAVACKGRPCDRVENTRPSLEG
jgi:hypothetical protein